MNFRLTYNFRCLIWTQGILAVAANTTERKENRFKRWTTIQLNAQTNFYGQLKMTANEKIGHFSSFSSGFWKVLLRSDVEIPRQAENDKCNSLYITHKNEWAISTRWISFTGPLPDDKLLWTVVNVSQFLRVIFWVGSLISQFHDQIREI